LDRLAKSNLEGQGELGCEVSRVSRVIVLDLGDSSQSMIDGKPERTQWLLLFRFLGHPPNATACVTPWEGVLATAFTFSSKAFSSSSQSNWRARSWNLSGWGWGGGSAGSFIR
jgi:hypothetical protein